MVLLPEEAGMTLAELRQMASRQQQQMEAQAQLLVAKEQRLKFLKQQEARSHAPQLDNAALLELRQRVEQQEGKLRKLRALRGQVEQQKTNNGNLGAELDSIRALFSEKEKELNLAVNKVDELSRQLDEIKLNKNRKNCIISSTASELENLRRELLYRTKLSEQQSNYICHQREDIASRQQDIATLDQKLNELTQRLHRKRLLNQQLASQIHHASVARNHYSNNDPFPGPLNPTTAVISVETIPDTQDDTKLHLSKRDEFSLTKNDPKYQTLPYNTKFTLKGSRAEDSLSSSNEEDSWPNSLDSNSCKKSAFKPVCNSTPRPFNGMVVGKQLEKVNGSLPDSVNKEMHSTSDEQFISKACTDSRNNNVSQVQATNPVQEKITQKPPNSNGPKPAVPPKPALPVKPMILSRQMQLNASKDRNSNEREVNAALSVLQKKASINEKSVISKYRERLLYYQCIPRYSNKSQDPNSPASKSKIATYFKKTHSETNSQQLEPQPQNGNDPSGIPKRKSSVVQLPIKPKPLTIRKTPGLEPPKLKGQTANNVGLPRKTSESNLISAGTSKALAKEADISEHSTGTSTIPVMEVAPIKSVVEKAMSSSNEELDVDSVEEVDLAKPTKNIARVEPLHDTAVEEEINEGVFHRANVRRMRKGNLKGENSVRNSRRVSFDPLALLLDAALEGELELVKKTATEVPNPSAANDEGITALHNAICAGHFDVVTFLVEFGCDVNAQDSDGWTPLHCAASCNNLAMVKFLVERGACVFATTLSDHETAAEKCEEDEEGFDGCSQYLFSLQENLGVANEGAVSAVYDYEMCNADELGFRDGDSLLVLRKGDDEESEWWWSRRQDAEGYVPRNLLGLFPRVSFKKDPDPTD